MRVAFLDPSELTLSSNRKGDLFERLTRRVVESSGYEDVRLRKKHNSLEYDIEGRHAVTRRLLSGEAKALDRNIRRFNREGFRRRSCRVGSHRTGRRASHLRLPPTKDANNHLETLAGGIPGIDLTLRVIAGDDLPAFISNRQGTAPAVPPGD